MKRILLEPAYVLHRRAYRETSLLLEVISQSHGRVSIIAKGVRKPGSSTSGLLQPFTPILVSWTGKGELMTLIHVEANGEPLLLQKECLFAGFYLNELLMILLQKWDAHPRLFNIYAKTLIGLQAKELNERILRLFEKYLLEELGYGLLHKSDKNMSSAFLPDQYYRFIPEEGFVLSEFNEQLKSSVFLGSSLLAMIKEEWEDEVSLQDAKRLSRLLLMPLLGGRTIHSRQLFCGPRTNGSSFAEQDKVCEERF